MTIDWSGLNDWTNDTYKPLYNDWSRFQVIFGGSGSGKSVFIAQRYIYRLLTIQGYNLLVTRKYGVTNRFSTFALMNQIIGQWNLESLFTVNKTDMTITAINGNQALFLGLDSQDKIKSITFKTGILQAVWMEEANEFEENDFAQLNLRLRGASQIPFQITISFNPVSAMHWLKGRFFDNPLPGTMTLKTTYRDNRFIDDAYRQQLESLTGAFRQVYALGEWGVIEGLVFKDFKINEIPSGAKLLGHGLDFGFSQDPCSLISIYSLGNALYFDELIYKTGLTNSDLSREIKNLGVSQYSRIIADSAEPKSIEDLHRAGWNVHPAKKGPDSIRFGLTWMMSKELNITPRSSNLQKEFYAYSWKKDKNGKMLPEPEDAWNHGIDACRYFCMDIAKGKPGVPKSNLRGSLGI